MHISQLDRAAALAALQSAEAGLTAVEAARRLREFGPNRVEEVGRRPLWRRFLREFTGFFALILWVAAALALAAEHAQPGEGMGRLAVAIVAVILINGLFSFIQEYRAERAVAALRGLLPQQVRVLREGAQGEVAAEALVPGDLLLVEEGERVPADCRLIEAVGIRVDLSTVTGESAPAARNANPETNAGHHGPGAQLAARNLLLAGTSVVSGHGLAVVFATGMRTEFGRIAHLTQTAGEATSPLQREIVRLSRLVAVLATALGLVFFFIGHAAGLPFWASFMFTIGIIVANVPEGLLPTVTLSLAMATQRMARRNALVRHLPAVEALGSTTVILSDKTGTLTCNRMTVRRVFCEGRGVESVGGDGPPPDTSAAHRALLRAAASCHSLRRTEAGAVDPEGAMTSLWQGDPMELALVRYAEQGGERPGGAQALAEQPFDSARKRMSVVVGEDGRRVLYCKGALESLLEVCGGHAVGAGWAALDAAARAAFNAAQDAMAREGLRVLAFAWRELAQEEDAEGEDVERDLILAGLAGLEDPPRPDVPEAIARCREAGIRVVMCTGDHPSTAVAIGREIGLIRGAQPVVLRGESLPRMSPAQLHLALDAPEVLFARVTAEQKMLVVQALQRKGEVVAVTGDGVNDAPALRCADIGIAMGLAGTDVAREAADMVLLDDHFATIVNAIEEGRAVFDNLRKFLTYILTSNIPELVPYLAFVLLRIPLPLTIMQILAVDLGTDLLPALALGAEKPAPDIMRRPPRDRGERLLNAATLARAYLWLGPMQAAIALAAYFRVLDAGGWQWGQALAADAPLYQQATTACLGAIVLAQAMNLFLCRDPRQPVWRFGLFSNPLLWWGIAVELSLLGLIVATAPGQAAFGTALPDAGVWLFVVPLVVAMGAAEEVRKAVVRRHPRRISA